MSPCDLIQRGGTIRSGSGICDVGNEWDARFLLFPETTLICSQFFPIQIDLPTETVNKADISPHFTYLEMMGLGCARSGRLGYQRFKGRYSGGGAN